MSTRKYIIIGLLVFAVILGPILLLSSFGLGIVQGFVDKNPKGKGAAWFQYKLGRIYYITLRPEKADEAFGKYTERYGDNKDNDKRYWDAMYYRAFALDDAYRGRQAAELFKEFYETCPKDNPHRPEAKKECIRLRHHLGGYTPQDD